MDALPYYKWYWIDYRANRKVQRMSWQARGLYRELLDEFWSEGVIPNDTHALADICGCPHETFMEFWPQIQGSWEETEAGLVNVKMEAQRTEMDRLRVVRSRLGEKGGKLSNSATRAKQPEAIAKQVQAIAKQVQAKADIAEQSRAEQSRAEQEQRKTKTPRVKREVHPLFAPLKEMVFKYYRGKNGDVDPPWDGMEAKQLSSLLASSPKAPMEHWHACLANRYKSDVSHGDRPGLWLPKLSSYRAGPLNGFNRPKETNIPAGRKYMTTSPFPGAELQ